VSSLRPEFKVGVLVVSGIVLLVLGVNYLKGFNPFAASNTYYAVYEDVRGLAVSNPVLINGFQVGQVRRVEFVEGGHGELLVEFNVEHPELYFPNNTVAMIHSSDLFGTKAIRLEYGDSPDFAVSGDTLVPNVEDDIAAQVQKQIEPLQRKTTDLIKGVDVIIENIQSIFEGDASTKVPEALESMQRMVESLERTAANLDSTVAENRYAFGKVMGNVRSLTTTLNANSEELTNTIQNLSNFSDSLASIELASTMARANQALADLTAITAKVSAGEGSLGKLVMSDSLHDGLVATNLELQLLLDDLQMHPWKYVQVNLIGRKPKSEFSKKDLQRLRTIIDEELEAQGMGSSDND
jgi:phospholipid/cholesterol/gamma-HCH transport system substrate-binding protein